MRYMPKDEKPETCEACAVTLIGTGLQIMDPYQSRLYNRFAIIRRSYYKINRSRSVHQNGTFHSNYEKGFPDGSQGLFGKHLEISWIAQ